MSAGAFAPVAPGDISVVICAYTQARWDDLVRAVESVERQEDPVGQVVVVIDHEDELLRRATVRFPAHRVVANDRAQGLSGARDAGAAECSGAVVAFLDDDAALEPDWSTATARSYDGAVLGGGGAVLPVWVAGRPRWWPPEFDWVVGCSYRGQATARGSVRNPIGANMSIRREVLEAVGGFDPRVGRLGAVPTGGEETELFIRARRAFPGTDVVMEPAAVAHHWVPAARSTWRYFARRCRAEGLSKRVIGGLVGTEQGLSAERSYVTRTLPRAAGVALRGGQPATAAALVAGLVLTAWGYVTARQPR
ncbi:glycosyltransferase family 2 protein [Blastococcus sp. URHD0036]|uniref:glycosyltransferase family 2 protein n=1 Tax=Blastococcus sp. URHD0036 TaxID=1380356 RepID=UPI001E642B69|nr:glycosyltransferase family 2 protein [Blastococcus sp. URHD0036]